MATISKGQNLVTLVNVFTVEPEDQQRLADALVEATENVMKHKPGYVSANIHKSFDGTRVVNYAQWRSREDFEAVIENPAPEVAGHLREAEKLGVPDVRLYEVAFSDGAPRE
ncbi:MAG: hypothetical protein AVDCRST_MAG02-4 [uncultured Rubrobacteraceae bacterium]|uniref:ABM domain-containing protein n=1 Tax=uncultured Rubrobacteraceae bacterium TaxID=349277 RepID=A0A6J4QKP3_9ACTN|nr:MAG: hypothetical protein AVDCRST_MAG02-4 [uncultured Rubrobacteraceae bacterium]